MRKNEKGNVMVFTVIAFAVLFVFTMAVMLIGDSSAKHANKEESKTKAHYVAKTGAESVIKHLEDTAGGIGGDMRAEILDLIAQTNAGNNGKGKYKEGDFEIEVKEETRKGKKVYLVKSTGEIGTGDHIGKDQMTAVLTPDYEVESSWGTGTVDAGDTVFIDGLPNLVGGGIILNTEVKKIKGGVSPIKIQTGADGVTQIMGLFDGNTKGDKVIGGYTLGNRKEDSTNIYSETLLNTSVTGIEPIEFNYGIIRKKPSLKFPTSFGSSIDLTSKKLNVKSPSVGTLFTGEYDVVEFDKQTGEPKKETRNKEFLKIDASRLQLFGNNTIETSRDTDVVIYTKIFTIMEGATLNIKGPGNVYIYATESALIGSKAKIGVDLDDPTSVAANTNIHFYLEGGLQMELEDYANARNTFVYGSQARFTFDSNSVFTGRMSVKDTSFSDEVTIQSPVPGTPNEDHDPIIGFESIEWER